MKETITKEIVDELMKIKGEVRGIAPKSHVQFVVEEKGEEVLKKIEEKMKELGYPVEYKNMKPMSFYPIGLEATTLLVIKELFNYDDQKLREIGVYQSKVSLIIKLFTKYFVSMKVIAQKAPEMWRKYYTVGNLRITELNEKEKYTIIEVKDFQVYPSHCRMLEGYFGNVVKMVVNKNTKYKETKCPFLGDNHHEFLIKW